MLSLWFYNPSTNLRLILRASFDIMLLVWGSKKSRGKCLPGFNMMKMTPIPMQTFNIRGSIVDHLNDSQSKCIVQWVVDLPPCHLGHYWGESWLVASPKSQLRVPLRPFLGAYMWISNYKSSITIWTRILSKLVLSSRISLGPPLRSRWFYGLSNVKVFSQQTSMLNNASQ